MKKQKYLITCYTQLKNGYIYTRQIKCYSKYEVKSIYDKLAHLDNTISIEVEEI